VVDSRGFRPPGAAGTPRIRFLAPTDAAGRVADFHALRHTFITNLARGGVHPKVAQQLARHSTITLTMDRYSHTLIGEAADALKALPNIGPIAPGRELVALRATGTDDAKPVSDPPPYSQRLGRETARASAASRGDDTDVSPRGIERKSLQL
jgi:hypothetical protein